MKRIVCMGGGPACLYAALLFRKALPRAKVEVYERNRPDDTFGWGVVFSDRTMENFRAADEPSQAAITGGFHHWDDIDVHYRGTVTTTGGHGFCGIERKRLLGLLQERGRELGVEHHFQHEVEDDSAFADADLVVAADGVNSRTRKRHEQAFQPDIDTRECRYIWLGTTRPFRAFTFAFEETEHGWFQIHAYQFSPSLSTVIVETRDGRLRALGTRFLVERDGDDGTLLSVLHSAVAARPEQREEEKVIAQGQHVRVRPDGLGPVEANSAVADAWTHGMLVVDNATSHAAEMAPLAALVTRDPGFSSCLVPVGKGEFLAVKKPA